MRRRCWVLWVGVWLLAGQSLFGQVNAGRTALKPVAPQRLAGLLKGRSEERRAEALAMIDASAIQQAVVTEALKESVDRDLRTKHVGLLTAQSLRWLAQSPREDDLQFVVKLTGTMDVTLAFAAAASLAERKDPNLLPSIVSLAQRQEFSQSFGFRRCLVDAVAQVPDKAAVEFLIEMAAKFDGQLRFETVRHLARLTGQNFGGHSDQWSKWWKDQTGSFQVSSERPVTTLVPSSSAVVRLPWPEPLPEFFGVPVYAKRVVFVIDRSGSMRSSVDGITRLDEAVKQLEKAVDALDRYAYFNVFAYDSDVLPFMTQLVQAEDVNKRASNNIAYRLTPDKKTASYDALYAGLMADGNLEAMYFLSDGVPTTGRIVDMPAIVESITTRNALQRTSIYTLGIDARGAHEEFLKALASRTYGQFVMIR
jgi:hypothetical protein